MDTVKEGEDSIEIVEIVGMSPDAPEAIPDEAGVPTPDPEEPGSAIPYSTRELYEMLLRQQAEFENARKRQERDRQESRRRLWVDLLQRLLPILDNFHRALDESSAGTGADSFREGVALTVEQMMHLLRREGLTEIQATGTKFDPHFHEAVETHFVEGMEEGIVLEELRKGYQFQGQLLRPTLVRVSARGGGRREGES